MKLSFLLTPFAFSLAAAFAACSASGTGAGATSGTSTTGAGGNTGAGGGATGTSTGAGTGGQGGGDLFEGGLGGSSGSGAPYLIYAHTDTTLFTLDPLVKGLPLKQIGAFDCIGNGPGQATSMTDIAVNEDLEVWTVSGHAVRPITIQGNKAHCEKEIVLNSPMPGQQVPQFYALSFAPVGVLDPVKEVLVAGNNAGELWSIDGQGNLKQLGNLGIVPADDGHGHKYQNAGKTWELSGDIVFLANGGKPVGFATLRDCPNPPSSANCDKYPDNTPIYDTLVEIDLSKLAAADPSADLKKSLRGKIVRGGACSDKTDGNYGHMYGIAAWNDKVYGFSRFGNLVDIDLDDASGCLVGPYPGDKFAGAGVTTLAPIIPPPN